MNFLNYEIALDFARVHPGAQVKQINAPCKITAFAVNGCLGCNALTADGEDWCEACKERIRNNQTAVEAICKALDPD